FPAPADVARAVRSQEEWLAVRLQIQGPGAARQGNRKLRAVPQDALRLRHRERSHRLSWLDGCCPDCRDEANQSGSRFAPILRMKLTVQTTVSAPLAEVWRAYTTPEDIKQWNAASDDWHTTAATVDLREGGAFSSRMEAKDGSMGFDFAGTYTKIVPQALIEYSFGDRMAQVEFTPNPKGVVIRVTFDSEPTHSIEQQQGGWQAILN